jgi:hypothetical protein
MCPSSALSPTTPELEACTKKSEMKALSAKKKGNQQGSTPE